MLSATTRPWYSPTCVSCHNPVTSPTAHNPGPTDRRSSTASPCGSAVTPTVSGPISATRGRPAPRDGRPGGRVAAVVAPVTARALGRRAEPDLDTVGSESVRDGLPDRQ